MSTLIDGKRAELMYIDQVEATLKASRLKLRAAELKFADQLEAIKALRAKLQEAERELELLRPVMAAVEDWYNEEYSAQSNLYKAFEIKMRNENE